MLFHDVCVFVLSNGWPAYRFLFPRMKVQEHRPPEPQDPENIVLLDVSGVGSVCFPTSRLGVHVCEELLADRDRYLGGYVLRRDEYSATAQAITESIEKRRASGGRVRF